MRRSRPSPPRRCEEPALARRARLLGGVTLAVAVAFACSTDSGQRMLPLALDGVPKQGDSPPPSRQRQRRNLSQENDELRRALRDAKADLIAVKCNSGPAEESARPEVEKARTWPDARKLLPKDSAGLVSWNEALSAKAIAPRASNDPKAPIQAELDLDVELATARDKRFSVTFAHSAHTRWLACSSCHPRIFPLGRGRASPAAFRMEGMVKGEACGACHGPVTFGVRNACRRCHSQDPVSTDWRPQAAPARPIERAATWEEAQKLLPKIDDEPDWAAALTSGVIAPRASIDPRSKEQAQSDVEVVLEPKGNETAKVIFRHATHTALLKCGSCHPALFEMEAGSTEMSMAKLKKGELCGACHGTVAFGVDACGRCHPAMAEDG
jgi:c(7)-type cytochrome triheme protein